MKSFWKFESHVIRPTCFWFKIVPFAIFANPRTSVLHNWTSDGNFARTSATEGDSGISTTVVAWTAVAINWRPLTRSPSSFDTTTTLILYSLSGCTRCCSVQWTRPAFSAKACTRDLSNGYVSHHPSCTDKIYICIQEDLFFMLVLLGL